MALQTSKQNSTQESTSTGTAAITAVILWCKSGRDSTRCYRQCLWCTPEEEVQGCQVRALWGSINQPSLADASIWKSIIQRSVYYGTKMGWWAIFLGNEAVNFSYKLRFPGWWIDRGGPINWPPQTPDLAPVGVHLLVVHQRHRATVSSRFALKDYSSYICSNCGCALQGLGWIGISFRHL
jgi:hypothetical protein